METRRAGGRRVGQQGGLMEGVKISDQIRELSCENLSAFITALHNDAVQILCFALLGNNARSCSITLTIFSPSLCFPFSNTLFCLYCQYFRYLVVSLSFV